MTWEGSSSRCSAVDRRRSLPTLLTLSWNFLLNALRLLIDAVEVEVIGIKNTRKPFSSDLSCFRRFSP